MFFQYIYFQKESLNKLTLILWCIFLFIILLPDIGRTFDKKLVKHSKGKNYPHILKSDNFSLNARNVKVLKSQGNTLWMGTSMGIIKYDTTSIDNYTVYDNRNSLLSNGIFSISVGPKNQLWFGTYGGGLSLLVKKKWININTPQGLNDSFVYDLNHNDAAEIVGQFSLFKKGEDEVVTPIPLAGLVQDGKIEGISTKDILLN